VITRWQWPDNETLISRHTEHQGRQSPGYNGQNSLLTRHNWAARPYHSVLSIAQPQSVSLSSGVSSINLHAAAAENRIRKIIRTIRETSLAGGPDRRHRRPQNAGDNRFTKKSSSSVEARPPAAENLGEFCRFSAWVRSSAPSRYVIYVFAAAAAGSDHADIFGFVHREISGTRRCYTAKIRGEAISATVSVAATMAPYIRYVQSLHRLCKFELTKLPQRSHV